MDDRNAWVLIILSIGTGTEQKNQRRICIGKCERNTSLDRWFIELHEEMDQEATRVLALVPKLHPVTPEAPYWAELQMKLDGADPIIADDHHGFLYQEIEVCRETGRLFNTDGNW